MFLFQALEDLFAMHRDILRRLNSDTHLGAVDTHYRNIDVVADSNGLTYSPR